MTAEHSPDTSEEKKALKYERHKLLRKVENALETPMIVLGFVWLVLLIVELLQGLNPWLQTLSTVIWITFIIDFVLKFILAPEKWPFLKKNVLTVISLFVPALRLLRVARLVRLLRTLRVARSLRLVKVIGSLNRGMRILGATMRRRAFGYVLVLTLVVLFTGSAGMYAFERGEGSGMDSYPEAVWWTAMMLITVGSETWPHSVEGRALCFVIALYGFGVFGYITATIATFFIGQDADNSQAEIAGAKQIESLHNEVRALREEIKTLLAVRSTEGQNPTGTQTPSGSQQD